MNEWLDPVIKVGLPAVLLFYVLHYVVVPLVKQKATARTEPGDTSKMQALELSLTTLETKVIALDERMGERIEGVENAVENAGKALDDKLDIILEEFRAHNRSMNSLRDEITKQNLDFSQRLAAAEANIRHLLNERERHSRGN